MRARYDAKLPPFIFRCLVPRASSHIGPRFQTFLIFPEFSHFFGIFPIGGPFPLSRPIKSTQKEHSRKGLRHHRDLSPKKCETLKLSLSQLASQRIAIAEKLHRFKVQNCKFYCRNRRKSPQNCCKKPRP